jgi:hypothetical protein
MRTYAAAAVLLALLAGPALGTCGDCCAANPSSVTIAGAPACCGDCGATIQRAPDSLSLAASGGSPLAIAAAPVSAVAVFAPPSVRPAPRIGEATNTSPPLPPPRPLRL